MGKEKGDAIKKAILPEGERCDRCGEVGEDRRTLFMACFYEMNELGLPFKQEILLKVDPKDLMPGKAPISVDLPGATDMKINLQAGTVKVKCGREAEPRQFYTLRVCKDCRAEWMGWIKTWFQLPKTIDKRTGTGAFIRRNGTNVEMTEEEIEEYKQRTGREPVRVKDA
jgi:hypothetical protein